ncbi:MAG: copper resistance protein CopC/CopD [Pigmentiphaga sp.]|nr:copper resistance protein CopC/CopD [Pigmentiphaga sp.]
MTAHINAAAGNGWRPIRGLLPSGWLLLAWLLYLAPAVPAHGHAVLLHSSPPHGALLATAPAVVELMFNEPVSPLVLQWNGPDGISQALPSVHADGSRLHVELPTPLPEGAQVVVWRVVSADGHPVGGALAFSVGQQANGSPPPDAGRPSFWRDAALWLTRYLVYAGLFFGVASQAYRRAGTPAAPLPAGLLPLALAAALLGNGLHGLDMLDLALTALATLPPWLAAAGTAAGATAMMTVLALMLGIIAGRMTPRRAAGLAALAILAMAAGFTWSGHASSAPPDWVARPAVWAHAIAVAAWLGSFWPLLALSGPGGLATLERFSRFAPAVVGGIVISGAALVALQLDSPADLVTTPYGRLLLLKLALVAGLLGVGADNRYRWTRAALGGEARAQRRLRRNVIVEIVLATLILGVAAAWRLTPPPRALAAPASVPPAVLRVDDPQASARLAITSPGPAGTRGLAFSLARPDGSPLPALEVSLSFESPSAGIDSIVYTLEAQANGEWRADDVVLPSLAHWRIRAAVLISDFDRIHLTIDWETQDARP